MALYAGTREDAAAAGFDDDFIYKELEQPIDQRRLPMSQLQREQALPAFAAWERSEQKVAY